MAEERARSIEITINAEISSQATEEEIADRVQEVLKGLAGDARGGLRVRTVSREGDEPAAIAGYESRLWEKATC